MINKIVTFAGAVAVAAAVIACFWAASIFCVALGYQPAVCGL